MQHRGGSVPLPHGGGFTRVSRRDREERVVGIVGEENQGKKRAGTADF